MMTRPTLLVTVLLFLLRPAWAINEEMGIRNLVQPDGTRFAVREFIDEFGHYLVAEKGYVIQNTSTGYYHYARYDSDGHATPSSLRVGRDDGSTEVGRLAGENEKELRKRARKFHGFESVSDAASAVSLPESLLVILVEFSDVKHQNNTDWPMAGLPGGGKVNYPEYTVSNFETMLFGNNYTGANGSPDGEAVYGSMRQYWADMSKGTYRLKGKVANKDTDDVPVWVELGETKSYFNTNSKRNFRKAALDSAASQQGIDISRSTTRKICIIYAGNMYIGGGLHPHYGFDSTYIMSERWADPLPNPRNGERNYANFSHIGVHCHEFGHILGLGDKYSPKNNPHNRGYHKWGLMADGGNKKVDHRGDNPTPLVPHHRAELGWLTPTNVTGLKKNEALSYSSATSFYQDDVYRIRSSTDATDFFLIENRQTGSGWNQALAASDKDGLLIWHIQDKIGRYSDLIDLIEADNSSDDSSYNGDPFPGSTGKTALTDFTSPSSRQWGPDASPNPNAPGGNSNVRVLNINQSGTSMTADLSPFWVDTIATNTSWSGTVTVGGDVTIASGATLTLAQGTTVLFEANRDDTGSGTDTAKSELIVAGTLNAGAGNITFGSTNAAPDTAEWYGLRVLSGGTANLTNATLRDGVRCIQNAGTLTLSNTTFSDCGMITEADSVSYAENRSDSVATYQATHPSNGTRLSGGTWSLLGADRSAFRWGGGTRGDTLYFRTVPNYEQPADANQDTLYQVQVQASGSGGFSLRKSVQVQVSNVEEAGTVSLSSARPQVDTLLTASLTDPDRPVTGTSWQWHRLANQSLTPIGLATSASYTPDADDVGARLVARASYTDGHGTGKSASDTTETAVVDVPDAPDSLKAPAGDKQIALRWAAADSNGAAISSYSLRDSTAGSTWSGWKKVSGGASARDTTRTGLTNGTRYWFAVRATNRLGDGRTDTVSATPKVPKPPPITGRLQPSFAEHSTDSVATYQAKTASGTALSWTLGGTDVSAFRTSGDTLYFKQAPNYEAPTDAGKNNQYDLTIRAVDGTADTTVTVAVSVSNLDEAGTVELSSKQPKVGQHLTASLTTEPDGLVTGTDTWNWTRLSSRSASAEASSALSTSYRYTVLAEDLGKWLVARVRYTDGHGAGKSASDTTTAAVVADVPGAPGSLTATAGDKQVVLTWTSAANNGSAIQQYAYRDSTVGKKWSIWNAMAGSGATTTTYTVSPRINNTAYWFQVRAKNTLGAGRPSAVVSATPKAAQPPTITGRLQPSFTENRTDSVATYQAKTAAGKALSWTLGGTDVNAFRTSGDTLYFKQAPNYEAPTDAGKNNQYDLTIRAVDGTADTTVTVTVSVSNSNEAGNVALSTTTPQARQSITATLTDPDTPITITKWQWFSANASATDGTAELVEQHDGGAANGSLSKTLTISHTLVGKKLKARPSYTDSFGSQTAESAYTSPVTAAPDQAGSVSLSPDPPQAGGQITATLTDPDGSITGVAWSWTYFNAAGTAELTETAESEGTAASRTKTITVSRTKVGYRLQFYASYTDGHGTGKSAQSAKTAPITAPPNTAGNVSLSTTTPQAKQSITATLTDPDTPS